jgi:hypothetical protein
MHTYTLHPPGTEARDAKNTEQIKPPAGTRPWVWKSEPIVRFRTDDGKVYLEKFHNLRGVYDEETRCLTIKTPDGMIAVTGPDVWELCEPLCAGKATMVRRVMACKSRPSGMSPMRLIWIKQD